MDILTQIQMKQYEFQEKYNEYPTNVNIPEKFRNELMDNGPRKQILCLGLLFLSFLYPVLGFQ